MFVLSIAMCLIVVFAGCWVLNAGFPLFLRLISPLGEAIEGLSTLAGNVFLLLMMFLYVGAIISGTAWVVRWLWLFIALA